MAVATIKGREIAVKAPTELQLMLLQRLSSKLKKASNLDFQEYLSSAGRALDILENLVEDPEDREWLIELTAAGGLHIDDFTPIVNALFDSLKDQPEEVEAPKPVARRGRPKRT